MMLSATSAKHTATADADVSALATSGCRWRLPCFQRKRATVTWPRPHERTIRESASPLLPNLCAPDAVLLLLRPGRPVAERRRQSSGLHPSARDQRDSAPFTTVLEVWGTVVALQAPPLRPLKTVTGSSSPSIYVQCVGTSGPTDLSLGKPSGRRSLRR